MTECADVSFIEALNPGDKVSVGLNINDNFDAMQIRFVKRVGNRELTVLNIPALDGYVSVFDPDYINRVQDVRYKYIRKYVISVSSLIEQSLKLVYGDKLL